MQLISEQNNASGSGAGRPKSCDKDVAAYSGLIKSILKF